MKLNITENDIRKMVNASVRRILREEITREMISGAMTHDIADAYEAAFNEKAPLFEPNAIDLVLQKYANATPEEKRVFEKKLNHEYDGEPIELLDLDDEF